MEPKYPIEKLEAIKALIEAQTGPVAIAQKIGVSRPTANKMIAETRRYFNMGEAPIPAALTGEHQKAAKAAKLLAKGTPKQEIFRQLGVGETKGERLVDMARTAGVVAMAANPEVMEAQVTVMLDVMNEISEGNQRLKTIADAARTQLETLATTTQYDIDRLEVGDVHGGWHQRMANIRQNLDLLRKVEDSLTKGVLAQQRILENLYDVRKINDMLGDIHAGIRDGLAELVAGEKLTVPLDEANRLIAQAIKTRFARRKGIV